MEPESILTDQGLNVSDSPRQEEHLQFIESFYSRIRGHVTGTSEHRSSIQGSTQPRRLMPTAYLSPQSPPAAAPSSSQQQNNFRPSNCGLVINLAPDWEKQQLPIKLKVRFSVFLPKIQVTDKSLRPMWQRFDICADIPSNIQDLVAESSPFLGRLNQDIELKIEEVIEAHKNDPLAWLFGLNPTIDDLTEKEVTLAKENFKEFQAELRQRIINKKKTKKNENPSPDTEIQPGQVAPIEFQVTVEAQKRVMGEQTRIRLFLRNKSEQSGGFDDPRDTGLFGAHLEINLPRVMWQPVELSRFQISYQVDSTVSAQGINCTPGVKLEQTQDTVRIWTEFLPIYWQNRLYTAGIQASFKDLATAAGDADLLVLKTIC